MGRWVDAFLKFISLEYSPKHDGNACETGYFCDCLCGACYDGHCACMNCICIGEVHKTTEGI